MTHLNVPSSLSEAVKTKFISDLSGVHRIGQILLIGEDKKESITEFIFVQHSLEFLSGLRNTLPIVRVDNEDDTLGILEIC